MGHVPRCTRASRAGASVHTHTLSLPHTQFFSLTHTLTHTLFHTLNTHARGGGRTRGAVGVHGDANRPEVLVEHPGLAHHLPRAPQRKRQPPLSSYTKSILGDIRWVGPRIEHLLSTWDLTNPESITNRQNVTPTNRKGSPHVPLCKSGGRDSNL